VRLRQNEEEGKKVASDCWMDLRSRAIDSFAQLSANQLRLSFELTASKSSSSLGKRRERDDAGPSSVPRPSRKPRAAPRNRDLPKDQKPATTPTSNGKLPNRHRLPPKALDISEADDISLLTPKEQICASEQRLLPRAFLKMKSSIIGEYKRRDGKFSRRNARDLFSMDVNKVGKVYDLLFDEGYLKAAGNGWSPKDGIGVPEGHEDEKKMGETEPLKDYLKSLESGFSKMPKHSTDSFEMKTRASPRLS